MDVPFPIQNLSILVHLLVFPMCKILSCQARIDVATCWNMLKPIGGKWSGVFFWSGQPGPNRRAERNRPNRNNLQTMLVVLLGFPVKPASQLRIVLAMSVSPITSCWRFCHDFSWSSRYHGAGDYPEGCEIGNRLKSVEKTFANHQQLAAIP